MKYTIEQDIALPRQRVVELFDNVENLKKWQPDLLSFEHLSGTAGHPGAKSKLRYKMGRREFDMIETVTVRNLPDEFSGTYEVKGTVNKVTNHFFDNGPATRWVVDSEFQCSGFMKIMAKLMPGVFKKQTRKFLENFKKFAESQPA